MTDTGPGLPPRAREHLFQAFQGGATKGGSGLGLAIAAEIVRGHGGRLELRRSDERGTEFAIRLPKSNAQLGPLVPAPEAADEPANPEGDAMPLLRGASEAAE